MQKLISFLALNVSKQVMLLWEWKSISRRWGKCKTLPPNDSVNHNNKVVRSRVGRRGGGGVEEVLAGGIDLGLEAAAAHSAEQFHFEGETGPGGSGSWIEAERAEQWTGRVKSGYGGFGSEHRAGVWGQHERGFNVVCVIFTVQCGKKAHKVVMIWFREPFCCGGLRLKGPGAVASWMVPSPHLTSPAYLVNVDNIVLLQLQPSISMHYYMTISTHALAFESCSRFYSNLENMHSSQQNVYIKFINQNYLCFFFLSKLAKPSFIIVVILA